MYEQLLFIDYKKKYIRSKFSFKKFISFFYRYTSLLVLKKDKMVSFVAPGCTNRAKKNSNIIIIVTIIILLL